MLTRLMRRDGGLANAEIGRRRKEVFFIQMLITADKERRGGLDPPPLPNPMFG